ncbi:MAG: xylulokinase [Tepidisphaerales bacterium]
MVSLLAIDVGSSAVKAAVLQGPRPAGQLVRESFPTVHQDGRAEVPPDGLLRAVSRAARQAILHSPLTRRQIDLVALSCMSPSWLAVGRDGKPLTPIVTHQDRRSVKQAHWLASEIGLDRHLALTGNLPVPGGISSTTARWFIEHRPGLMRRARLVGHVQTWLLHHLTGCRAIDPSNASFTGLWNTTDTTAPVASWNDELVDVVGLPRAALPPVLPGDAVAGRLTPEGGRCLNLPSGVPVLTGVMDTSAAVLLAGQRPGTVVNACGSTDALAMVTDRPRPDRRCLCRHLGVGRAWLTVMTLAAAGSALTWARVTLFPDLRDADFINLLRNLGRRSRLLDPGGVTCVPDFAGSRTELDPPTASFRGLTLATTRHHLLSALLVALSETSAARWPVLTEVTGLRPRRPVLRTGGAGKLLTGLLHGRWPKSIASVDVDEAALRGLGVLAEGRAV